MAELLCTAPTLLRVEVFQSLIGRCHGVDEKSETQKERGTL